MAICPKCGAANAEYLLFCGKCGEELPKTLAPAPGAGPPQRGWVPPSTGRHCPMCGMPLTLYDMECPTCRYRLAVVQPRSKSDKPMIAGVLMIITGALALVNAAFFGYIVEVFSDATGSAPPSFMTCCMLYYGLFGLASLVGGILALQRRFYSLALVGAILGMLTFVGVIGFVLNLIAIILLVGSKDDFEG